MKKLDLSDAWKFYSISRSTNPTSSFRMTIEIRQIELDNLLPVWVYYANHFKAIQKKWAIGILLFAERTNLLFVAHEIELMITHKIVQC